MGQSSANLPVAVQVEAGERLRAARQEDLDAQAQAALVHAELKAERAARVSRLKVCWHVLGRMLVLACRVLNLLRCTAHHAVQILPSASCCPSSHSGSLLTQPCLRTEQPCVRAASRW